MPKRLKNLVFVSGPHGSGKSTLIKHLVAEFPNAVSPELETKTPQFYWGSAQQVVPVNFCHRQALKYAQRAIENYEYYMAAKRDCSRLVFGDRCVYDSRVYRAAGVKLGWLTLQQSDEIEGKLAILNLEELLEPFCIVLNPGFDVCSANLEKRWRETSWVKFMETDMEYLKAVCGCFEEYAGLDNVFYLDKKLDYSDLNALNFLKNWIVRIGDTVQD